MTDVGRDLLERNCVWFALTKRLRHDTTIRAAEADFAAGDQLLEHAGAELATTLCTCPQVWRRVICVSELEHVPGCDVNRLRIITADGREFTVDYLAIAELGRSTLSGRDRSAPAPVSGDQLTLGGAA